MYGKLNIGACAVLVLMVLLLAGGPVQAASEITGTIADFKLFLNGNQLQKEIINFEGRSYLSLRDISEALGLEVQWDGEKRTINLNGNMNANKPDATGDANYNPVVKPSNFSNDIANKYFPLVPGKIQTYRATSADGSEDIKVEVLSQTKMISGVTCTVVRDTVSEDGEVTEDTYDWYARDIDGNVWYMGESVSNYDEGILTDHSGSFEAGVDGAKPGILMLANPVLEMPYRQEYSIGQAEDWGKVIAMGVTVSTPYGTFSDCIKTLEWNGLEPNSLGEYKFYAPEIGLIREEAVDGSEVVELISYQ